MACKVNVVLNSPPARLAPLKRAQESDDQRFALLCLRGLLIEVLLVTIGHGHRRMARLDLQVTSGSDFEGRKSHDNEAV